MRRGIIGIGLGLAVVGLVAGCEVANFLGLNGLEKNTYIRIYLVNDSATYTVSPKPGLCPQGLENLPHYFAVESPLLAPGESISYTTVQLAGLEGYCAGLDNFMIGLCGWKFGTDPAALTSCSDRYGGAIGVQFNCGDTVILRWTDMGGANGVWTSEILPAQGNPVPTTAFQPLPPPEGGTCGG